MCASLCRLQPRYILMNRIITNFSLHLSISSEKSPLQGRSASKATDNDSVALGVKFLRLLGINSIPSYDFSSHLESVSPFRILRDLLRGKRCMRQCFHWACIRCSIFPDGPDAQHVALVLSLPLIVPQLFLLY